MKILPTRPAPAWNIWKAVRVCYPLQRKRRRCQERPRIPWNEDMTFLDSIRMRIFKGYDPQKPVTVEWWSGRQHADVYRILDTAEARDLIRADSSEPPRTERSAGASHQSATPRTVKSNGR
jgi:hypothetical protein